MRYTIHKSLVYIVGRIWMPSVVCSQVLTLSEYDLDNIRALSGCEDACADDGSQCVKHDITREGIENWLGSHAGDFQSIIDFSASIEDDNKTLDFPWSTEDGETQYDDTLPSED